MEPICQTLGSWLVANRKEKKKTRQGELCCLRESEIFRLGLRWSLGAERMETRFLFPACSEAGDVVGRPYSSGCWWTCRSRFAGSVPVPENTEHPWEVSPRSSWVISVWPPACLSLPGRGEAGGSISPQLPRPLEFWTCLKILSQ